MVEENGSDIIPLGDNTSLETPVMSENETDVLNDIQLNLGDAKTRKKKRWILVIVLVIVVVIGVVAIVVLNSRLANKETTTGDESGKTLTDAESNIMSSFEASRSENNGSGDERVEEVPGAIDTEAEELYKRFVGNGDRYSGVNTPEEHLMDFRFNSGMRDGQLDRYLMLTLAKANIEKTLCRGTHISTWGDAVVENCYSGDAMRKEIERLFGQKLQFTESDVAGRICGGYDYDADSDEFFQLGDGCGFAAPQWLASTMVRAERDDDRLYIYEKVLLVNADIDGVSGVALYHVADDGFEGRVGVIDLDFDNYESYQRRLTEALSEWAAQSGDEFKWIFRKTSDGNYVFEKIEEM